jgi:hypothetical protein
METVIRIHRESEYNEILQQAVAVIETARGNAARAIVSTSNDYVRFHLSNPKLQRNVGVLPWRHINPLMAKLKDDDNAIQYYAEKTVEKGWNCDLLINAIKLEMHKHLPETNVSNNFV